MLMRLFRPKSTVMAVALTLTVLPWTDVRGDDWPTFRGSNRSAVAKDTNLLQQWPEDGPELVWQTKGAGRGYSSLAISGDKIFTLGDGCSTKNDEKEYLTCYDRKTGKQLWAALTGAPWTDGQPDWQSSRSTPTVDGDLVYVVSPSGMLVCCETATGKEVWRKHLKDDLGGNNGDIWGYSESVLIDGDKLLCTPGGKSTIVALNKKTGAPLWKCVRPDDRGAGHSSIVPSTVGGKKVYVQVTASGPMGFSPEGTLLWSYPIEQTTSVIPTPIVRDDLVFFAVGYKRGGALLRQVPGASGEVKIEEVYGLNTKLANKHGGVVLMGDYVFGDSDDAGVPYCAELMTGKEVWRSRGSGKGSAAVVGGDGMLYIQYANGILSLVKASPEKYEEVSKFKLPDSGKRPCWAHPVIVDGKLYTRTGDELLCYNIAEKR